MARILHLASKLPRIGVNITRGYPNSRIDTHFNRTVHFKDTEFEMTSKTNIISNDKAGFPFIVHIHDLDEAKISKPDKKKIELVDVIAGLKECLGSAFDGEEIKIVATKEFRKELEGFVKDGTIRKEQVISAAILERIEVDLDPFSVEEAEIVDENVNSLADIRKQMKIVKDKKAKEVAVD